MVRRTSHEDRNAKQPTFVAACLVLSSLIGALPGVALAEPPEAEGTDNEVQGSGASASPKDPTKGATPQQEPTSQQGDQTPRGGESKPESSPAQTKADDEGEGQMSENQALHELARDYVELLRASERWNITARLILQNDWIQDEHTRSSLGFGAAFGIPLPSLFSLDVDVSLLFKEGDVVAPFEVSLRTHFDTISLVEPYIGIGPVITIEAGHETEVLYGGLVSIGANLHSNQHVVFNVDATYRLLGGGPDIVQHLAIGIGLGYLF